WGTRDRCDGVGQSGGGRLAEVLLRVPPSGTFGRCSTVLPSACDRESAEAFGCRPSGDVLRRSRQHVRGRAGLADHQPARRPRRSGQLPHPDRRRLVKKEEEISEAAQRPPPSGPPSEAPSSRPDQAVTEAEAREADDGARARQIAGASAAAKKPQLPP